MRSGMSFQPRRALPGHGGSDIRAVLQVVATPELLCDKVITNMSREQRRDWISPNIEYQGELCPGLPAAPG